MNLVTSGDAKKQALQDGVPEDRIDYFIQRWHAKKQYLDPVKAYQSVLMLEKRAEFGDYPGQIPKRDKQGSSVLK